MLLATRLAVWSSRRFNSRVDQWFVSNGKKVLGPFSERKMHALAEAGKLKPGFEISRDQERWIPAADSPFVDADDEDEDEGEVEPAPTGPFDELPDPFDQPLIRTPDEVAPLVTAEQVDHSEGSIVIDAVQSLPGRRNQRPE